MPTHFTGTPTQTRALNAYITLMRAADSVTSRTTPPMLAAGLSVSQFGALECLLHLGPLCQAELGRKLLKTSGNIVMVVDNLERRGLVRRTRSADDRRYVTVSLTPAGSSLIKKTFPRVLAAIVGEFAALSPTDQQTLRDLCRKLGMATTLRPRRPASRRKAQTRAKPTRS